jgi:hypothetical protein
VARKPKNKHAADTLGHAPREVWSNGQYLKSDHRWFGRCRCGWECKYTRATREAALNDHKAHVEEMKARR